MTNNNIKENFMTIVNKKITNAFIGKRIISAGYMTDKEMTQLGWRKRTLIIKFEDNTIMYASNDNEGNEAGVLYTSIEGFEIIPTI